MQRYNQGNTTHVASARSQNDGWKPPPVFMLVMGLSGCGKSNFINLLTGQSDCSISTGSMLCTRFPRSCRASIWINNYEFRFIDTPGFANDTFDDRQVLERLVEYFAPHGDRLPRRVAGLLYIHSEDEPLKGRTSRKTIEMLVKVLGERFLDRVTVLIRTQNGPNDLAKSVQSEDSPLYPLYCNNIKPWATIPYTPDPQSIVHILQPYIELSPRLVWLAALESFVQRYGNNRQYNDIPRHLRELFPEDVGPLIIPDQADIQTRLSGREDELEKALAQKEEEIKALKSTHEIELKDIQGKSMAEKADDELQRGSLCNTIRDQKAEISELQSRNSSVLEESEALKQLNSKKDSDILALQGELAAKDEELMKVKDYNDHAIRELTEKLRDKESEVAELKSRTNGTTNGMTNGTPGTTTKPANKQGDEIHRLKAEIDRISAEYGSLRTHMQLQENTEQADIMKALGDINRLVEEFGQTISEHIETHMERNPPEKPLHPKDLLSIFGQVKGDLASKIKQDAYLLLEYAVRAVMCNQLYTYLFKPFHPSISDDRNVFVAQIHAQLACQHRQIG
ncbi:hypothetical protein ACGC1H_005416 [Rhizoctonia solani]|uniref:G domain-containing protein n=1 Tax=Rhizoctonia solani TaxID=456999 RepID=A0A8H2WQX2_9AGAM|nr:unnamed protein product [Rhizoctonia solani]